MTFEQQLRNYAELLIAHGLNVQPGQVVNISSEAIHRDFCYLVAEAAYERGAKYVNIDLIEPRLARLRIEKSSEENLTYVPGYLPVKYRELVDDTAANIKIIGSEDPDILADLNPKRVNTVRLNQHLSVKYFYDEGIGKSKVHWTVAAAATPKWGQKVFPASSPEKACRQLWEQILRICRADQPDCLQLWKDHNDRLQERGAKLTAMKIKELHFTGPGTDLRVGLSDRARFKGGSDRSPRGVEFEPNIPTEEVFTTPDARMTRGHVKATRPFLINGKLITDLELQFEEGKISSFKASHGEDTFREYIQSDENSDRLGEVALVGIDSPVYTSGLIFQEILFDENAACHIAIGSAYKFCIEGGESMTKEQLEEIGCNDSTVHTDIMISSDRVSVSALTYQGENVELIRGGEWAGM